MFEVCVCIRVWPQTYYNVLVKRNKTFLTLSQIIGAKGTAQPLPLNILSLPDANLHINWVCVFVYEKTVHLWLMENLKGEQAWGHCILVHAMTLFSRAYTYFYPWMQPPAPLTDNKSFRKQHVCKENMCMCACVWKCVREPTCGSDFLCGHIGKFAEESTNLGRRR